MTDNTFWTTMALLIGFCFVAASFKRINKHNNKVGLLILNDLWYGGWSLYYTYTAQIGGIGFVILADYVFCIINTFVGMGFFMFPRYGDRNRYDYIGCAVFGAGFLIFTCFLASQFLVPSNSLIRIYFVLQFCIVIDNSTFMIFASFLFIFTSLLFTIVLSIVASYGIHKWWLIKQYRYGELLERLSLLISKILPLSTGITLAILSFWLWDSYFNNFSGVIFLILDASMIVTSMTFILKSRIASTIQDSTALKAFVKEGHGHRPIKIPMILSGIIIIFATALGTCALPFFFPIVQGWPFFVASLCMVIGGSCGYRSFHSYLADYNEKRHQIENEQQQTIEAAQKREAEREKAESERQLLLVNRKTFSNIVDYGSQLVSANDLKGALNEFSRAFAFAVDHKLDNEKMKAIKEIDSVLQVMALDKLDKIIWYRKDVARQFERRIIEIKGKRQFNDFMEQAQQSISKKDWEGASDLYSKALDAALTSKLKNEETMANEAIVTLNESWAEDLNEKLETISSKPDVIDGEEYYNNALELLEAIKASAISGSFNEIAEQVDEQITNIENQQAHDKALNTCNQFFARGQATKLAGDWEKAIKQYSQASRIAQDAQLQDEAMLINKEIASVQASWATEIEEKIQSMFSLIRERNYEDALKDFDIIKNEVELSGIDTCMARMDDLKTGMIVIDLIKAYPGSELNIDDIVTSINDSIVGKKISRKELIGFFLKFGKDFGISIEGDKIRFNISIPDPFVNWKYHCPYPECTKEFPGDKIQEYYDHLVLEINDHEGSSSENICPHCSMIFIDKGKLFDHLKGYYKPADEDGKI